MDRPIRDELLRKFGQRVAARRKALGFSQAQLAELLGLANAESISRYERGSQDPRLSTVVRLAECGCQTPTGRKPRTPQRVAHDRLPVGQPGLPDTFQPRT